MSRADSFGVSIEEKLIDQFYEWELRGRGWVVYPEPVGLEPPFRPFYGHYVDPGFSVDDGRRPTLLSSLFERLSGKGNIPPIIPREEKEPDPDYLDEPVSIAEIQAALPKDLCISRDVFEQFLLSLPLHREPLGFEIIGNADSIITLFASVGRNAAQVQTQLESHFPDAVFRRIDGLLVNSWMADEGENVIVEFGLSEEFMVPFLTLKNLNTDPFVGLTGALMDLQEGELGMLQMLFQPMRHPWAESTWNAVTDNEGSDFFNNKPELLSHAKAKIAKPLFAAVLRIATKAGEIERAWQIARSLTGVFRLFAHPRGNSFIPLDNEHYDPFEHEKDLLLRQSRRGGMILNSDELVSLVHLPNNSVRSSKLERQVKRTKAPPVIAIQGEGLVLGENIHAGKIRKIALTQEQRVQHTHIIGASGTGKSTLLLNLILQDIEKGQGVGVLDPHGDLIEKILPFIPEDRIEDVIFLNASDEDFPVGFNILSAHSSLEKTLLSSDLVSVFRRLSTSWGDQMTSVLGNAILAFLESSRGGTLIDLRRFLIEVPFRNEFLTTVEDPEVVYFWKKEFPLLSGRPQASLLTRLDTFLRPKPIRYMVGQKQNRLNFADIMNSGKILLAKLPQGEIGEENAYLLGTLLVSKFQQLVIARQSMKDSLRRDFFLYIDEFHHFITPSMATILNGARKYRLGLVLAHQELHQLDRDPEVASAVRGNPYTRICFRVGDQDARKLEDGFSFFEAQDIQSLGRGEAICRVERSDFDFNLSIPSPTDRLPNEDIRQRVIEFSRSKYSSSRNEVEAMLAKDREASEKENDSRPPLLSPRPEAENHAEVPTKSKPEPKPKPAKELRSEPTLPGRGGPQHK